MMNHYGTCCSNYVPQSVGDISVVLQINYVLLMTEYHFPLSATEILHVIDLNQYLLTTITSNSLILLIFS